MDYIQEIDSLNHIVAAQVGDAFYELFLYGSSAVNIEVGRDIDAVAITTEGAETRRLLSVPTATRPDRLANIYFVSQSEFTDDVCFHRFGGYYCEKFSLNFSRIGGQGVAICPPLFYWRNAAKAVALETPIDSYSLIRTIHRTIMNQKPLFAAPLTKFLKSPTRILALMRFIDQYSNELIVGNDPISPTPNDTNERYWREYSAYKDDPDDSSRQRTQAKVRALEKEIDDSLISRYFDMNSTRK